MSAHDDFCHWLIGKAARRAPRTLSERLEEEWLAELEERPQGLARLRFSLGCCWAMQIIAYDQQPHVMASAANTSVNMGFMMPIRHSAGSISRRTSSFLVVALLHVAVFYAFLVSYSHTHTKMPAVPFDVRTLPPIAKRDDPPPRVDVGPVAVPRFFLPDREFPMIETAPSDPSPTNDLADEPPVTVTASLPPTHLPARVIGGPGLGFPNVNDYYPAMAIRKSQEGVATIQVCVDVKGRLTSKPINLQSAGSVLLDEGALELAKAASGHYRPSTEDGAAVASCYPYRVRFQLKK
jgi:TonB family protein